MAEADRIILYRDTTTVLKLLVDEEEWWPKCLFLAERPISRIRDIFEAVSAGYLLFGINTPFRGDGKKRVVALLDGDGMMLPGSVQLGRVR